MVKIKVAILIDGGFYVKRANHLFGEKTAQGRADELAYYCKLHLKSKHEDQELYRIFYYDCPPINGNVFHPYTKKNINYGKSELCVWMNDFLDELKTKRKFAIRLGRLSKPKFVLKPDKMKAIFENTITFDDIAEDDFVLSVTQKGVDMKIGVDIASIVFKKQAEQIILISGDSDFVPAAKLARREGIDFILDPMISNINSDLSEHIDGIRSQCEKLMKKPKLPKI